jgi:hypothetical protein
VNANTSFVRRCNLNGTHDSICRGCFATVALVKDEAELARHERDHLCDPVRLYEVREDPCFHGALASWLREISSSRMPHNRASAPHNRITARNETLH